MRLPFGGRLVGVQCRDWAEGWTGRGTGGHVQQELLAQEGPPKAPVFPWVFLHHGDHCCYLTSVAESVQTPFSRQERWSPKIEVISSLSDNGDPDLDDASPELENRPADTPSHIFTVSRDTSKEAEAPFANILKKEEIRDLGIPSQVPTSPRVLIEEISDPESSSQLLVHSCWGNAASAPSSNSRDEGLPAAPPPGKATTLRVQITAGNAAL